MEIIVVQVDADLEDLIPGYLRNRRQDADAILRLVENLDFQGIRILGHTMKGTGGGFGFDAITEMGQTLEEAANNKNVAAIRQVAAALVDYLQAVEVVFHDEPGPVIRDEDAG